MRRDAARKVKYQKATSPTTTKTTNHKISKQKTRVPYLVPAYELLQLGRNVIRPPPRRLLRRSQLRRTGFQLREACLQWRSGSGSGGVGGDTRPTVTAACLRVTIDCHTIKY